MAGAPLIIELEVRHDLEAPIEVNQLEVRNDLKTPIELNHGMGWTVVYPLKSLHFKPSSVLDVRLRDDPAIRGRCHGSADAPLLVSQAFGNFGPAAANFVEAEQASVKKEKELRDERLKVIQDANRSDACRRQTSVIVQFFVCSGTLIICTVSPLGRGVLVSLAVIFALGVFALGLAVLRKGSHVPQHRRQMAKFQVTASSLYMGFGMLCTLLRPGKGILWVFLNLAVMVVFAYQTLFLGVWIWIEGFELAYHLHTWLGPKWLRPSLLRGIPVAILGGVSIKIMAAQHSIESFAVFLLPTVWGIACLNLCRRGLGFDSAVRIFRYTVTERHLVYEGQVLANHPCICSWPGKYEAAWDVLVQSSRGDSLSAAVVFLPAGSDRFGRHDQIPAEEKLEGECWCVPLYGEKKPWGCKWWTLWMANIEEAVRQEAELQVYFFEKKKGQGKVQSFATAGLEHMRREKIYARKKEFEQSTEFQRAEVAGLQDLSQEIGPDGSSQHSRESGRLFLAWLPEEDRQFLEKSEGLGNSQKAEVAWLEKKGYTYTEIEIDVAKWQKMN